MYSILTKLGWFRLLIPTVVSSLNLIFIFDPAGNDLFFGQIISILIPTLHLIFFMLRLQMTFKNTSSPVRKRSLLLYWIAILTCFCVNVAFVDPYLFYVETFDLFIIFKSMQISILTIIAIHFSFKLITLIVKDYSQINETQMSRVGMLNYENFNVLNNLHSQSQQLGPARHNRASSVRSINSINSLNTINSHSGAVNVTSLGIAPLPSMGSMGSMGLAAVPTLSTGNSDANSLNTSMLSVENSMIASQSNSGSSKFNLSAVSNNNHNNNSNGSLIFSVASLNASQLSTNSMNSMNSMNNVSKSSNKRIIGRQTSRSRSRLPVLKNGNEGTFTLIQLDLIKVVTKQIVLTVADVIVLALYLGLVILSVVNDNFAQSDTQWIVYNIVYNVSYIVTSGSVWLSFSFADREYYYLCKICDNCCLKACKYVTKKRIYHEYGSMSGINQEHFDI